MEFINLIMSMQKVLDLKSIAMVSNFLQHVLQHPKPNEELQRLLLKLDPELDPKFKLIVSGTKAGKGI